jgi:hypothetical protein
MNESKTKNQLYYAALPEAQCNAVCQKSKQRETRLAAARSPRTAAARLHLRRNRARAACARKIPTTVAYSSTNRSARRYSDTASEDDRSGGTNARHESVMTWCN